MKVLLPGNNRMFRDLIEQDPEKWGFLVTPGRYRNYKLLDGGCSWAMDNGAFKEFDAEAFETALDAYLGYKDSCLFVVAPDKLGDHDTTVGLWDGWYDRIAGPGYRAAFVAQDGCEIDDMPWDELSAVFIGGTNEFKDKGSREIIHEAHIRGKWVHVGRVNDSVSRLYYCLNMRVDSIDGTAWAFKPKKMLKWFQREMYTYENQLRLFA